MQGPWRVPLVQHAAHGGDGGTPERARLPAPAGAPVGAVCPEASELLVTDRVKWRFRRAAGAGMRARKAVNHWATKGIANHEVQRLRLRKSGSVLARPTRTIL